MCLIDIKFAGNVISFCLFMSPMPTFVQICKAKSVQDFKPDPYVVTVLNCAMWSFYGMPFVTKNNVLVLTINGFGFFLELFYTGIFLAFSPWGKRVRNKLKLNKSILNSQLFGLNLYSTFFNSYNA
ncbi:hypothetical protein S245_037376 [Arachis hypogaea]